MDGKRQSLELLLFRLTMWAVVLCSFGAIGSKAIGWRASSVPLHYLMGFAVTAALLAVVAPNLERYVLSKVSKVTLGSIEVQLIAEARTAAEWLKYEDLAPDEVASSSSKALEGYQSNHPFPASKLDGPQRYQYESHSHKLYQLFIQIDDANELDAQSREKYRNLITAVSRAAYRMGHFTKSLDLVARLQQLRDRPMDADELLLLGSAYLWAAEELADESARRAYWKKSLPILYSAMQKNPYEEKTKYNLGWVMLALGQYHEGIYQMQSCIRLRESLAPWAKWNIACGLKKLGKDVMALDTLEEVPPGPWWKDIEADDWFVDEKNPVFAKSFKDLCTKKKSHHPRTATP